jgi:Rieske Fe-S protein
MQGLTQERLRGGPTATSVIGRGLVATAVPFIERLGANDDAFGPNWPGGYFCPCHGSKFDYAGRVFKNVPALRNLDIPDYAYLSNNSVRIGEEHT